jgi:DNA helicase-2/ATP-dependent DNA helicase PcrA
MNSGASMGSGPVLNAAQRDAVEHGEGPLLILAGAGSGKTRVLTARIANLVRRHGVDAARILAVTFTNKAAGEMLDRITRLLGARPPGMWIGTFHSLGARLMRAHAAEISRTSRFTIYDPDDTVALIGRIIVAHGIRSGDVPAKAIMAAISDAKNRLVDEQEFATLARDPFGKVVAQVYSALEPELRANNAATFDDLLTIPVSLLSGNPELLTRYQQRFRHILVDEYQDTNHAQFRLVSLLGGDSRNVCVVGDDDQSIYGWRGADIRNILDFEKTYPGARVVRLEENYRSTPQILQAANIIISQNTGRRGKTLRATLPPGAPVSLTASHDERDEAEWIADEIMRQRNIDSHTSLDDFAVVYRTNAQSRILEEVFRRHGMVHRLVGAVGFFERREVRDLLAWLRLIANPSDNVAFLRAVSAPKRGIGTTSLEHLAAAARERRVSLLTAAGEPEMCAALRQNARTALAAFASLIERLVALVPAMSVGALLQEVIEAADYVAHLKQDRDTEHERLENVRELVSAADALTEAALDEDATQSSLDIFLQHSALFAEADRIGSDTEAVTLMTVHNAKGLEFPIVFISGLEEGLFPIARAMEDPKAMEEERRLLYVGVTRAQRRLCLSYAASRRRNGEVRSAMMSSFLRELSAGIVEERPTIRFRAAASITGARAGVASRGSPASRRTTYETLRFRSVPREEIESQAAATLLMGARVRHGKFGPGTVAEISGIGRDAKVTVDFDDEGVGRKRLMVAFAGLESGWDE